MTDFQVRYDEQKGYYDIPLDDSGNLILENSLDNAINMSLFCDARADESEVQVPELRRGWWGNSLNTDGHEIGSKLWLLKQRRERQKTQNDAKVYINNCLRWLLDGGIVSKIEVSTAFQSNNSLIANIKFTAIDNTVEKRTYNLFLNTAG